MPLNESWWNDIVIYFARFHILMMGIPIIIALVYRKEWNRPLLIFFLYCLLTYFLNLFEAIFIWATGAYTSFFMPFLEYWDITSTAFMQIFYELKSFILLSLFYSLLFSNSKIAKHIIFIGYFLAVILISDRICSFLLC